MCVRVFMGTFFPFFFDKQVYKNVQNVTDSIMHQEFKIYKIVTRSVTMNY